MDMNNVPAAVAKAKPNRSNTSTSGDGTPAACRDYITDDPEIATCHIFRILLSGQTGLSFKALKIKFAGTGSSGLGIMPGHRAGAAKFVAVELACRLTGMSGPWGPTAEGSARPRSAIVPFPQLLTAGSIAYLTFIR